MKVNLIYRYCIFLILLGILTSCSNYDAEINVENDTEVNVENDKEASPKPIDLNDWPLLFVKDGEYIGKVVIPSSGVENAIAGSNIAKSILKYAEKYDYVIAKDNLLSEIEVSKSPSYIQIKQILSKKQREEYNLAPGEALIILNKNESGNVIFILAYHYNETLLGSEVLVNFEDYNLEGNKIKLRKEGEQIVTQKIE